MDKEIIVSDFDGTISDRDSLYEFFEEYADEKWTVVEELWRTGKISSKECLIKEFELVPNLSEKLINEFTSKIKLDKYFKEFYEYICQENLDFVIVSDGVDCFINRILKNNGVNGNRIKITSNHGEFINGKFKLSFPNDFSGCKNDSGTCKCKIIQDLKQNYKKTYYIGDGVSDLCVADKADCLFAKKTLLNYCRENNIQHIPYNNFRDVYENLRKMKDTGAFQNLYKLINSEKYAST